MDAPEAKLHQLWTEQLYQEYDAICRRYHVRLRPPQIRLAGLGSRWAVWDAGTRSILVEPRLIRQHSWDAVLEILKHEMAHQLVSEEHGAAQAHGPEFAEACRRLRVAPWAVRAAGAIVEGGTLREERALSPEDERLLRRVEKLLSLATSSNEHEALLAMQRVQEIYARHDIERLRAQKAADLVVKNVLLKKKRVDRLVSMLFSVLAEHFFVRIIYGWTYDPAECDSFQSVELIGTHANVAMAEYVHRFLEEKLASLWQLYRRRPGVENRMKRDYMYGVLNGFRLKLAERQDSVLEAAGGDLPANEARALVALGERQVDDYIDNLYPRLGRRKWSVGYRDSDSYEAGVEEGRRIVLNRPLGESPAKSGRLLPER